MPQSCHISTLQMRNSYMLQKCNFAMVFFKISWYVIVDRM